MKTNTQKFRTELKSASVIHPEGLYRWDEFSDRIPFTRETWRKRVIQGLAPSAIITSRACTAWRGSDILAWLENPSNYNEEVHRNVQETAPAHRHQV